MGKTNSKHNSQLFNQSHKEEEFKIIKNNILYNIKLLLDGKDTFRKLKISVSCLLNNGFQIYETYIEKNTENLNEIYQNLAWKIKSEQIEILHQNFNGQFSLLLQANINLGKRTLALLPILTDDKRKLNELTKSYSNLEKEYIKLKQELKNKENQSSQLNQLNNIDDENENNSLYNNKSDDDDNNYNNSDDSDNNYGINIRNNIRNNYNHNSQTKYENRDGNHILLKESSSIWCMLKLNRIVYKENDININLDLAAIGFGLGRIILINLSTLKIYQELLAPNTVYSLAQFKSDNKYLICSLSNGKMVIYILKEENKYEEFQVVEKPLDLKKGEFNKVITLSDGNIATAERGAVSIWKPKEENGVKKFEFFKELITHNDTCQLLEVNPQVFACSIYRSKIINVYKNDGDKYPIIGQITNAVSHGNNSNGMTKINDEIFCSGGEPAYIYIVQINPVRIIQKIILSQDLYSCVRFLHNSGDGFIFTSIKDKIIQYKIITDEEGDFIELQEFDVIKDGLNCKAVITTDDGKIFYTQKIDGQNDYNKYNFFLTEYKKPNLNA